MDGFEIDFANNAAGLWTAFEETYSSSGFLYYLSTKKRTGSGAIRFHSTSRSRYRSLSLTLPGAYTELYGGFGFLWDSTTALIEGNASNSCPLLNILSSTGVVQVSIGIDATSNVLKVYRGLVHSNVLLGSGATGIISDGWHYVEWHLVISDTVGVIDLKLDGNAELSLTSQDTNNAGGGDIKTLKFGQPYTGDSVWAGVEADFYFDDFIVNDTTGTVSNSWPDGAGITMLVPNADGNYTAWTSTGGAVDYTEIDDVTTYGNLPDGDTTTILSGTTGQRTSVGLSNTTQPGSVEAIMLCTYAKNSVSGSDNMAQSVRIGSTDYDSTAFVPATAYGWRTDILTLNPATAARWLTSELDTMQQGFYRVT